MESQPTSLNGRQSSSTIHLIPPPSSNPSSSPAPRKATALESPKASSGHPKASFISRRKATDDNQSESSHPAPEYSSVDRIAGRKATAWEDEPLSTTSFEASASNIAVRKYTAPPLDLSSGALLANGEGSSWGWFGEIVSSPTSYDSP